MFSPHTACLCGMSAGCFWGPELLFQREPGVLATEVGYSNGQLANPTYEDVCSGQSGHAEVVRVVYDPEQVRGGTACGASCCCASALRHSYQHGALFVVESAFVAC